MSTEKQVPGFCYVTNKDVAMTPSQWRKAYPPRTHTRRVENGETFYSLHGGRIVAEVYANIPAGP